MRGSCCLVERSGGSRRCSKARGPLELLSPPAGDSKRRAEARCVGGARDRAFRGQDQYESRHIPGALSIPLEELREAVPAESEIAKDKPVVVYLQSRAQAWSRRHRAAAEGGLRPRGKPDLGNRQAGPMPDSADAGKYVGGLRSERSMEFRNSPTSIARSRWRSNSNER